MYISTFGLWFVGIVGGGIIWLLWDAVQSQADEIENLKASIELRRLADEEEA